MEQSAFYDNPSEPHRRLKDLNEEYTETLIKFIRTKREILATALSDFSVPCITEQ